MDTCITTVKSDVKPGQSFEAFLWAPTPNPTEMLKMAFTVWFHELLVHITEMCIFQNTLAAYKNDNLPSLKIELSELLIDTFNANCFIELYASF